MMRGMETPEQPDLVANIVIDEMGQFPDNIPIDQPIPREAGLQQRMRRKESNAKPHRRNTDKTGDEPVGDINKKRHPVVFDPEALVDEGADDLDQNQQWNDR